eukprot:CAMPEP_0113617386 /NCGR_PEP_ID=MMETSP0017_2-20120614/8753_1 /TAXON_ID=2856 /ORGANISM="Cylindrotheca closterium" /LENGTH=380 /DNA_ID=CAMNT_0000526779 /DNA_START=132 /DNA_END=1274 /DNA_ORIENTATION=+ /assembly_acc=CAM_ASM_000147
MHGFNFLLTAYKAQVLSETHNNFPSDYANELLFHVQTVDTQDNRESDCGGCDVLWILVDVLKEKGFLTTGGKSLCPPDEYAERARVDNRTIVVIRHEGAGYRTRFTPGASHCDYGVEGPDSFDVRWILSELGTFVGVEVLELIFGPNDLIFHYNSGWKGGKGFDTYENILQVTRNPFPGDETDISKELFYNKNRSGIAWMWRKADFYHKLDSVKRIHNQKGIAATKMLDRGRQDKLALLQYEYFIIYDPFSYWAYIAGMFGTVPIVYPLENTTKYEWIMSLWCGPYVKQMGLDNIPGVAYGWDQKEIEHARKTMHELRPFLFRVKEWGADVTVLRFTRDCYRYRHGQRENFEGALLRDVAYPKHTWKDIPVGQWSQHSPK